MREIALGFALTAGLALGLVLLGAPLEQTVGAGFLLRLLPMAGGGLLGLFFIRILFGRGAEADNAVAGTGAFTSPAPGKPAPTSLAPVRNVRAAAILGQSLILAACILAAGRVI